MLGGLKDYFSLIHWNSNPGPSISNINNCNGLNSQTSFLQGPQNVLAKCHLPNHRLIFWSWKESQRSTRQSLYGKIKFEAQESSLIWSRSCIPLLTKQHSTQAFGFGGWVLSCTPLLLKVWSVDLWHQRHQGACQKSRVSGPTPDPENQNPHFNKSPGVCAHTEVWETLLSISLPLPIALWPLHLTSDYFLDMPKKIQ